MPHPDSERSGAEAWRGEFPLDDGLAYLNHAAVGPWPRRTARIVAAFAEENLHRACTSSRFYREAESVRGKLARWLGAPDPDDLAIVKNTSEAISFVAHGLDWKPGDNVVLPDCEFPSNRAPWRALESRGVEARLVDARPGSRAAALIDACDRNTRLVAASSVQYDDGARLEWEKLADFCAHHDILLLLDAIQSVGPLPLALSDLPVDFVAGGSHKWLLAPEGLGYLYAAPAARERVSLSQHGWRMTDNPLNFGRGDREPAASARRFEPGTLNTTGMLGLAASLSLLLEVGQDEITRRIEEHVEFLIEGLRDARGLTLVTPAGREQRAGIVSFSVDGGAARARALHTRLRERGIYAAERSGLLRFSPHFHTRRSVLERTVEETMDLLADG